MIDKREILAIAHQTSLTPHVVEKDYVLGWMLAGIYGNEDLAESWIFKERPDKKRPAAVLHGSRRRFSASGRGSNSPARTCYPAGQRLRCRHSPAGRARAGASAPLRPSDRTGSRRAPEARRLMRAFVYGEPKELDSGFEEFVEPSNSVVVSIDMHQGHLADTPDCPCPAPRARGSRMRPGGK